MGLLYEFAQQMVNGLSLGSIYALLALGYTMVYGIVKLINFAHGDVLMLGAFAGFFVLISTGLTPLTFLLSFLVAMVICAVIGIVIERTCYKPLRNAPRINTLITAIGVSFFLENGSRVIPQIGPNPKQFPDTNQIFVIFDLAKQWFKQILGVDISRTQIMVFLVSIVLMLLLTLLVNFSKTGKAMRAVSFDRGAAYLMGINVNRIISFTFALGTALAAAAGILYASAYPQVEPYMGIMPGLKAFVAAVLGGIGSIPGAMLGGLIMGVAETLTKGFISSQLADAIAFGILIIILVVKPSGIMGKTTTEKV